MDLFVSMLPKMETTYKMAILYNMRSVGQQWVNVLGEHRQLIEELAKEPTLKDSANGCIDIIEGRRFIIFII